MKNMIAVGLVVLGIASAPAMAVAGERLGDGILGAASGAIVFGPVGALAGGLVGYTAGPAIARSWGLRGSRPYRSTRAYRQRRHVSR